MPFTTDLTLHIQCNNPSKEVINTDFWCDFCTFDGWSSFHSLPQMSEEDSEKTLVVSVSDHMFDRKHYNDLSSLDEKNSPERDIGFHDRMKENPRQESNEKCHTNSEKNLLKDSFGKWFHNIFCFFTNVLYIYESISQCLEFSHLPCNYTPNFYILTVEF